jgi:putative inorganic carbon (hco3(-)) transporter
MGHLVSYLNRIDLQPTTLPTTPSEPPRQKLWAAAMAMVRSHPLLGVGPDSYRLSYGLYTHPKLRTWDTRIFANSLFLELFADLGLLGGGLFLAFFAVATWPVIAGVWQGQAVTWWQMALVGAVAAFLGHGLVDYVLGADAIFVLFWLLCGLAVTVRMAQRGKKTQPC